jgi:5-carboxymethyl-2-hydroxymuconate isomerase
LNIFANLEKQVDIASVVHTVEKAALATGVFELAAVRTRAECRDCYVMADNDMDNAFVAVWVRIAMGRDAVTRKNLGEALFHAVCTLPGQELRRSAAWHIARGAEIDSTPAFRKNNLDSLVKERAADVAVLPQNEGIG